MRCKAFKGLFTLSKDRKETLVTQISPIYLLLTALVFAASAALAYASYALQQKKPKDLRWRGLVKIVSLSGVPNAIAVVYPRWFGALVTFYVALCIWVAYWVWGSDHSFFVVLFPLLAYYFFMRFFFWEKSDLND